MKQLTFNGYQGHCKNKKDQTYIVTTFWLDGKGNQYSSCDTFKNRFAAQAWMDQLAKRCKVIEGTGNEYDLEGS